MGRDALAGAGQVAYLHPEPYHHEEVHMSTQSRRPWVYRPLGPGRLTAWMPYDGGSNRRWLLESLGRQIRPEWNKTSREWEIARSHLRTLVEAMADRFGEVDVYLEFSDTQRCDTRCAEALGDECECSCLGENHGGAAYWKFWLPVGDTTLIAPGRQQRHYVVRSHN